MRADSFAGVVPTDFERVVFADYLADLGLNGSDVFEKRVGLFAESYRAHGVTQFAALTLAEARAGYMGYVPGGEFLIRSPVEEERRDTQAVPESYDLRTTGVVNPVEDQGGCGSCWAFAASATLEGRIKVAGGPLFNLAEQQLVSCRGGGFCSGGNAVSAWNYVRAGGQVEERVWPYTATDAYCNTTVVATRGVAHVAGNYRWLAVSEVPQALLDGPVVMTLDGTCLLYYSKGVLTVNNTVSCCTVPSVPNHQVTVVGWGIDPVAGGYWLVKNQWGSWWGEGGYFRIARTDTGEGVCGSNTGFAIPAAVSVTANPTVVSRSPTKKPSVPTSAAPTSAAPTSASPTSASPTSAAPTSASPTSAVPTTENPTTSPTQVSTPVPTSANPTTSPSETPTSAVPSSPPTLRPTYAPSPAPTGTSAAPTNSKSKRPTRRPTHTPTRRRG